TAISYVDDMGTALLHAVQSLLEVRNDFGGTVNQAVAVEQVERGNAGCAGHRVGRVGVAMGEFHHVFGEVLAHEGVVDLAVDHHGPHGDGAVGHLLRDVHDVGGDTEEFRTGGGAHAAEGGDDFVKDQQDVVLVATFAQALQVALGRNQPTRRAGHGLDNDGGDIRCVVQLDQLEQFVRQLDPTRFRLAASEGQTGLQGVGQVIDIHEGTEHLAVAADAAEAGAADVHAVIAACPTDELGLAGLAFQTPVRAGNLDGGVGSFRTGVREEHVVQVAWGQGNDLLGQLK